MQEWVILTKNNLYDSFHSGFKSLKIILLLTSLAFPSQTSTNGSVTSFLSYNLAIQESMSGRFLAENIHSRNWPWRNTTSDSSGFLRLFILPIFEQPTNNSFTSYKQPIWISNFCNKFLFTYFVSKYWSDKSFNLRTKYIKKSQYNSLHTQKIK